MFHVPEHLRITKGPMRSHSSYGNNGAFELKINISFIFYIIASDGEGWEHVSISLAKEKRCPTWNEMCTIKKFFWNDEDLVVQYHPPKSKYINRNPKVLHLWRKANSNEFCELPPLALV